MLIAVAILAVASTALADGYFYNHYDGHFPGIKYDGFVEETPEVKQAKAAHFAALAHAIYNQPAPLNNDGTVDDTYDVKHAKAVLFKAHNDAKEKLRYVHQYEGYPVEDSDDGYHSQLPHIMKYFGPFAPLNHDGTVDETPDVKHAKQLHFQLYNQAIHRRRRSTDDETKSKHYEPAPLNPDGTVADTQEVLKAKEHFFNTYKAEYAKANLSWVEPKYNHEDFNHVVPTQYHIMHSYYPVVKPFNVMPEILESAHPTAQEYHGYKQDKKYEGPLAPLKEDGTVDETPEVKQAKAIHFSALAHAGYPVVYYMPHYSHYFEPAPLNLDGTVDDTDEVKHAKAVLLKAYMEAQEKINYIRQLPEHMNYKEEDSSAAANQAVKPDAKETKPQPEKEIHHRNKRSAHFVPAPLNPDGTVDDTDDVKHARDIFLAAHAAELALADNSWKEPKYYDELNYNFLKPILQHPYTTENYQQPKATSSESYSAPIQSPPFLNKHINKTFIPAPLNTDGTVAETPEIKAAKAIHFAAHQEAFSRIIPIKYNHPYY